MHDNTIALMADYATPFFTSTSKVLEIGPSSDFKWALSHSVWHTAGITDDPKLTMRMGEYSIPTSDSTYDIIFSCNVMEHVRNPWVWLGELFRVCKPGGHIITIVPANWPFHEDPIDCWRVYPDGMRALYEAAGLRPLVCLSRIDIAKGPQELGWFPEGARIIDTIGIGRKPCS